MSQPQPSAEGRARGAVDLSIAPERTGSSEDEVDLSPGSSR